MSPTPTHPETQRSGLMTALVAGALIALLAAVVYLFVQIDKVQTDMAKMKESIMTELTNQKDASSVTKAAQEKHLESLRTQLQEEQTKASAAAKNMSAQAQREAIAHADTLTR